MASKNGFSIRKPMPPFKYFVAAAPIEMLPGLTLIVKHKYINPTGSTGGSFGFPLRRTGDQHLNPTGSTGGSFGFSLTESIMDAE